MRNTRGNKQRGAVLILTLILLAIMVGSSLHFFGQTMDNTKIAGASRDSAESLLLAESAMELMRGRFINNLDTDATVNVAACDVTGVSLDKCESFELVNNISDPSASLMKYMYFVSSSTALESTTPSLLQRVANGEAANTTASILLKQNVPSTKNKLRINDLFGASFKPELFSVTSDLIANSNAANWDAETGLQKAAAWVEVIINPANSAVVDLYVQAVSQVGNGKTYLQRYLGSYFVNDTLGGFVPAIAESSEINRDVPPPP